MYFIMIFFFKQGGVKEVLIYAKKLFALFIHLSRKSQKSLCMTYIMIVIYK